MTTTLTTTIPYAKLVLSDANVRRTNGVVGIAALAASIAEHGLIQPLIVSPATPRKTKYQVHAGGRRWRAIGASIEAGTLPKDYAVEVKIVENEHAAAREISLAENLQREAMSPGDECLAYRDIIADGASAEDVARRFGVTVRHVHGRLRLADLAEPIFAALAAGEITLDVAMAYGSVSDQTRQLAAWESCSKGWEANNPQTIRRTIAADTLLANHPIALLVGEADYLAAGGRIDRDLFAGEGEGTWSDAAIAKDLAMKKLTFEAEVAQLGTKLGWVKPLLETYVSYEQTKDLNRYHPAYAAPSEAALARIAEIEARLDELNDALDGAEDEDSADAISVEMEVLSEECDRLRTEEAVVPDTDWPNVGTFLFIGADGSPKLASQYYTTAKARGGKVGGGAGDAADQPGGDDVGNVSETLPRALEEQLAKDRRDILALHVAHDPALALDLAIFNLARNHAGHFGYNDTGCTVMIADRNEPVGLTAIPVSAAVQEIQQARTALPGDWALEEDSFASFLAFRALDEQTRASWLAYAVSQSLKASLASGERSNRFQTQLGALIGIDTAQHWRPGAERFFDRIKKSQILGILGTIDPEMPGRYALAKKGELASAATRLCAGDTIVDPAVKERAMTWIPAQMAFDPGASADAMDDEDIGTAGDLDDGEGLPVEDGDEANEAEECDAEDGRAAHAVTDPIVAEFAQAA
jgi:ParB family transcriptional regulator, chromosome partitioning protein